MDADLTATPTIVNGQVTEWKLCDSKATCGTGKSSSPYPKIDLKKGTTDHSITIKINDGNGITFAQTDPLWIQENSKPLGPIVSPTSQIDPSKISGGGTTTLKFKDANTEAMTLKYALKFQGGNGIMSIDPDIQNGGKGIAFDQTAALLLAGGVVVALVLLIVWRRSARRQSMQ